MTSKTDHPRTAATEAADLSNDALIYQFAQEAIHALNGDTSFDRHDALHAELTRRLTTAAPPSGQVCVDAEALAWLIDAAEEYAAIQAARTPVIASERQEIESEVECITAAVSMARAAQGNGTTS